MISDISDINKKICKKNYFPTLIKIEKNLHEWHLSTCEKVVDL